jgi:hypothetical protein
LKFEEEACRLKPALPLLAARLSPLTLLHPPAFAPAFMELPLLALLNWRALPPLPANRFELNRLATARLE